MRNASHLAMSRLSRAPFCLIRTVILAHMMTHPASRCRQHAARPALMVVALCRIRVPASMQIMGVGSASPALVCRMQLPVACAANFLRRSAVWACKAAPVRAASVQSVRRAACVNFWRHLLQRQHHQICLRLHCMQAGQDQDTASMAPVRPCLQGWSGTGLL